MSLEHDSLSELSEDILDECVRTDTLSYRELVAIRSSAIDYASQHASEEDDVDAVLAGAKKVEDYIIQQKVVTKRDAKQAGLH